MALPPPPPGYEDAPPAPPADARGGNLLAAQRADDPLQGLLGMGVLVTNAFRTDADDERLRAQGYTPAKNSKHKDGDGVDLTPGNTGWSMKRLAVEARKAFGPKATIINEGHHVHVQMSGWNGGLPAAPPGYDLAEEDGGLPPPPPGFEEGQRQGAPVVDETGVISQVLFDDQMPERPTFNWTDEQKAELQAYVGKARSPEDLNAFALKLSGGKAGIGNAAEVLKYYRETGKVGIVTDVPLPEVPKMTDGAEGAVIRGVGDPFNVLDELGAVADTVGLTEGRENLFNSDRSAKDILFGNIDRNRAVLDADARDHPVARFGGQLLTSLVLPFGAGARTPAQLAKFGAAEGALAGFGAGEGNPLERAPNTAAGAGLGAAGGWSLGRMIDVVSPMVRKMLPRLKAAGLDDATAETVAREAAYEAAPVIGDGAQQAGPTPAARSQPQGGVVAEELSAAIGRGEVRTADDVMAFAKERGHTVPPEDAQAAADYIAQGGRDIDVQIGDEVAGAVRPERVEAMAAEFDAPQMTGRVPDEDLPPLPEGYEEVADLPLSGTRPMMYRASAEEMAAAAERVDPEDVIPIPGNRVESAEELEAIGDGRPLLEAPDEFGELGLRRIPSRTDLFKTINRRGPLDLTAWLRTQGGLKDSGGELAHMGLGAPRNLDFPKAEGQLGRLIDADNGLDLDEATLRAWEAGFFPDQAERPPVDVLLDALRSEANGAQRFFRPDDLEEVARFEAARAERGRIEAAAQEGTPLADDIGQPITKADLDANEPPATAYEDLPTLGGKVANINLAHLETRSDIRRALQNVETKMGGFDAARRGKVTQAETSALASELGMTPNDLLRRRQGQALNAEQALAARRILAKSGDELVALAAKARGGSEDDLLAFRKGLLRHAAIQEQVTGATAEAGRALAEFKIAAKAKDAKLRVLKGLIEAGGGRERLEDIADAIVDLQRDPRALNRFALESSKPKFKDKAVELWYNWLLSGPQTHVVNVLSNTLTSLAQLPEHFAAAAIGTPRRMWADANVDRVMFSEVGARANGWLVGLKEGLRQGAKTFRTGEASDFVSKVEQHSQKAISGVKGDIIRIPTRALSAEDELFKAMARRMEISGLAMRQAAKEFDDLPRKMPYAERAKWRRKRAAELAANPTEEMLEKAFDYGRYVTFQRPLGPVGSSILRITNEMPILKLVMPFVRTPTNLFKFALERSPAAPLLREWREDVKAGGARRDLAVARAMVGSAVGAMFAQWAGEGRITGGGPIDDNARNLLRADGWQPYSIKIGDKYVSYARLDPFATTFGIAADLATKGDYMTKKEREEIAALVTASIMQQLQSKTWLSGLTDLVEAVNDPQRFGEAYISRLAGSIAVPAGVAQLARTVDPILREAKEPLDRVKSRIPYLSKNLPERLNIWGQPIVSEGGIGPDIASPMWVGTRKNDPVTAEMLSIGAVIGKPQRKVAGVELSDREFAEYHALSGRLMHERIAEAMQEPSWADIEPWERVEEVDAIKREARQDARETLFSHYIDAADEQEAAE